MARADQTLLHIWVHIMKHTHTLLFLVVLKRPVFHRHPVNDKIFMLIIILNRYNWGCCSKVSNCKRNDRRFNRRQREFWVEFWVSGILGVLRLEYTDTEPEAILINIKILNISSPRVGIEPKTCRVLSHACAPAPRLSSSRKFVLLSYSYY